MGYYHMGVSRALWLEKLLPRVISGASAGSLMAALIGEHSAPIDPALLTLTLTLTCG